jgi:undecaprenyl-diphosphatase
MHWIKNRSEQAVFFSWLLLTRNSGGNGMLELLKAVLWGIVEGITEWLPISSTGHMILLDELIKLGVTESFKEMFLVVIQLGAILAVVLLYFSKLNPFSPDKTTRQKKDTLDLWGKVIAGVLPAAVLGFLLDDWLDEHLYNYITVAVTLILYGILFIIVENRNKNQRARIHKMKELTYKTAFFIGLFQVLALIPGTSRSGATILGGILLGASRSIAAEFSFFLSIPVMFGASALKLVKFGFHFNGVEIVILLVGMIVAFFVSVVTIKFLLDYIKKNDFKVFGWYRIFLGLIVVAYFLIFS